MVRGKVVTYDHGESGKPVAVVNSTPNPNRRTFQTTRMLRHKHRETYSHTKDRRLQRDIYSDPNPDSETL